MSFICASLGSLSLMRLPGLAINDKNLQSFIKSCCIHAELGENGEVASAITVQTRQHCFLQSVEISLPYSNRLRIG